MPRVMSADFLGILSDFRGTAGAVNYLKKVSAVVSKHRHQVVELKKPSKLKWKIGPLSDTMYSGQDAELVEWANFYLPKGVNMEVIGVVENFPCPCGQLVLLAGDDRLVYAYDGEELHCVAGSLDELCQDGLQYPGNASFYRGQRFNNTSEHGWDQVRQSDVGKKLDREHKVLVKASKFSFMESLNSIQQFGEGLSASGSDPLHKPVVPKILAL